jgi:hypothetical protein
MSHSAFYNVEYSGSRRLVLAQFMSMPTIRR